MLAADPPSLDGARAAARRALRDVERACALIARMRALVAKKEIASEPLDLNDAIQEVTALVSSELYRHSVVLRTQFAEELPRVMGDRVQLQQVVLNLLINSAEAMRDIEDRPRQLLIETEAMAARKCASLSGTPGPGSTRGMRKDCSTRSTRPRVAVWASVCISVAPSSKVIEAVFGLSRTATTGLRSHSPFRMTRNPADI